MDGPWAWFTTQELDKQWGDDHSDSPYEYNAGPPYRYNETGQQTWKLFKIAWEGPFQLPLYPGGPHGLGWSVQQINRKDVPWLTSTRWDCKDIYAGVSVDEFTLLIEEAGGVVYLPIRSEYDGTY